MQDVSGWGQGGYAVYHAAFYFQTAKVPESQHCRKNDKEVAVRGEYANVRREWI
jgi:hypothetical protein